MKKTVGILLLVTLFCLSLLTGCGESTDPWASATYTEDTVLGEGAKTVTLQVKVGENKVVFTLHTDRAYLGEALLDHGLIVGEQGSAGFYVTSVNGIEADYDRDGSYWGFYREGNLMGTGVSDAEIHGGEKFELIREG